MTTTTIAPRIIGTNSTIPEDAAIFLTDYASYNDGSQFEFGHWVKLNQFANADELNAYITKHFQNADKKSPLGCFSPREEIMITDFEGFPSAFYDECMNFEQLFEYFERAYSCGYNAEIVEAFANLGNYKVEDIDTFFDALEESYSGEFSSDEDFAQDMAEQCGLLEEKPAWPYTCINWRHAAQELMYDYYKQDGHYFRCI
ncbi:MAG: antirestriction protein ArdA [Flammeovirgaceae bacterium]|jgi:antirestriction protein|nr:antirestriction protein ArdA [Flammeovirgaceae bacterium]